MPNFSLNLIHPDETSLETFDFDDDLWTVTNINVNVERYTGDADRPSCMRFYGNPFVFGDINPYTGEIFEFGDLGPGLLPIQFGDSWKGVAQGVYKDYNVIGSTIVNVSYYVRSLYDNSAMSYIHALDHTNGDVFITGLLLDFIYNYTWRFRIKRFLVPATCNVVRMRFVQSGSYRTDFLIDNFAFCASALNTDPDDYSRLPVKLSTLKPNLGVKRQRDKRAIHYDFKLGWKHVSRAMYDRLQVLHFAEEKLYFIDGEVPQLVEEFTIYDNATYNFVGITNPSATHIGYVDSGTALPTAVDDYETTEIATVDYQEIDADDANYNETTDPADEYYLWHKFRLVSAITGSDIQRFRMKVVASSDDSSPQNYDGCIVYAWDGATWDELARTSNDSKNDLTYSTVVATVAQQYVDDSGYVYLLLRSGGTRNGTDSLDLKTYFVEVEINDGLDLVIMPTHRPRFPTNVINDDLSVKNKTTGSTLVHDTDYTYDYETTEITIIGESSGDVIEVTYYRCWEVEIAEIPEVWLRGDPGEDRDRALELLLRTITGSL